jgi:ferritin
MQLCNPCNHHASRRSPRLNGLKAMAVDDAVDLEFNFVADFVAEQ